MYSSDLFTNNNLNCYERVEIGTRYENRIRSIRIQMSILSTGVLLNKINFVFVIRSWIVEFYAKIGSINALGIFWHILTGFYSLISAVMF